MTDKADVHVVCEMIFPGHPDDPHGEKKCLEAAVGVTGDNVVVCKGCAGNMLEEGFSVFSLLDDRQETLAVKARADTVMEILTFLSGFERGIDFSIISELEETFGRKSQ